MSQLKGGANLKRARGRKEHGFLKRAASASSVLKRRRVKGRRRLAA